MKSKYLVILYILSLIAGALLTLFWQQADIFRWIVMIIGIIMVIPCAICLVAAFVPVKKGEGETAMTIQRSFAWTMILAGIGGTVFGLLLIFMPDFFVKYIVYTLGVLLLLFGVTQLSFVSLGMRYDHISGWFLTIPVLTIIGGVVIICVGSETIQDVASLVTGIIMIAYSINGFWGLAGRRANHLRNQRAEEERNAEEARLREEARAAESKSQA